MSASAWSVSTTGLDQLKDIIVMDETHMPEADWAGPVEGDAYVNYGAELPHPQF